MLAFVDRENLHTADGEVDFTGYDSNSAFGSWVHGFDRYRTLRLSALLHRDFDVPRTDRLITGFGQTQPAASYGLTMPYSQQFWHRYQSVPGGNMVQYPANNWNNTPLGPVPPAGSQPQPHPQPPAQWTPPAPFKTPAGHWYLEVHHHRRKADGGPDHPRWDAALCPNCHRRVHCGEDGAVLNSRIARGVEMKEPL